MDLASKGSSYPPAGILRRLIAMFYDSLLLVSVLLLATGIVMFLTGNAEVRHEPLFQILLLATSFLFYTWFWLHGGQTLGMRAWRLRVQRPDGRPITLWQATLRFTLAIPCLALGGLGFFWMLVDRDRMTLYDRLSRTVMVVLPKQS